jgi:hypothetical protein
VELGLSLDLDLELLQGITKRGFDSSLASSSSAVRLIAGCPSAAEISLYGCRRLLEELVTVPGSLPGSILMVIAGSGLMNGTP